MLDIDIGFTVMVVATIKVADEGICAAIAPCIAVSHRGQEWKKNAQKGGLVLARERTTYRRFARHQNSVSVLQGGMMGDFVEVVLMGEAVAREVMAPRKARVVVVSFISWPVYTPCLIYSRIAFLVERYEEGRMRRCREPTISYSI